MEDKILYLEKQRFRTPWVWALLMSGLAVVVYSSLKRIVESEPGSGATNFALVLFFPVALTGIAYLLYRMQLVTLLREDGIYFKFFLLQRHYRHIRYSQILNYELKEYQPASYGGGDSFWGLKVSGNNIACIGNSRRGVEFHLKDGSKVFISTQDEQEFLKNLQRVMVH